MNIRDEALKYAKGGFSVIPIGKDKKPTIPWKKYQSEKASEAQIKEWFDESSEFNIGIVTGKISGIVVVDVEAGGETKDLQSTVISKTGGGGWHFYYEHPGREIKNATRICEKTDIRGDGGYVVAPPSLHKSGKRYEWSVSPFDADFSELPVWVVEKLGESTGKKTDWKALLNTEIFEGSRNSTAAQIAGKLLYHLPTDLWEISGWSTMKEWNNTQNKPSLPEKEMRATWDSIMKYHSEDVKNESIIEHCNILLSEIPKNTPQESILKVLTPLIETLAACGSLAEAEIYIRNKVKTELNIKAKDVDSIIKHFKKMRAELLLQTDREKKKAEQIDADKPLTEEEAQIADKILQSPTLLFDVLKMVKRIGVVGEEKNILLHYIIFTSRKLTQPLSATVKGDSSSGKSYTLLTTIKLFPKSAYIDLTDATPQSFYYCTDDYFKHKIIVIFEKHGGERADYAIRTLQSEGKLKIQVTVKNPDTGNFEAQTIEKEGPTGFVTTTTASLIHSENDTRNISMFPDQSAEQTSRVYESVDSRYLGIQPISEDELKPWHHAQQHLEKIPVNIPFAKSFRKYFPNHIVRTRRDYGHFLAIVETVAFLHQKQRERVLLNGQTYIRATLADAYIAKVIVEDALSKSIYELPEKTIEVVETAKVLLEELKNEPREDISKELTFNITGLAKKMGLDRDTVAKWLKPAIKKGYLTVVEAAKGSKGAEYKLEEKELPEKTFLPSVSDLANDNPDEDTGSIYDPLTGEGVSIEQKNDTADCPDAPMDSRAHKNVLGARKNTLVEPIGASVESINMEDLFD